MKLRSFTLLTLLVAVSLLVQGAPLPAAARTVPDPAAPTAFSCNAVTEIPRVECEALVALSPGSHVVTLVATDRDGATATAGVNVFAGSGIFLPLTLRRG